MSHSVKLSRLQPRWVAALAAVTLTIAGTAAGVAGPASAAPLEGAPSAMTAGAVSPLNEFTGTTLLTDQNDPVDVEIGDINFDTSCVTLDGVVTPEDIAKALDGRPQPTGGGQWEYVLCAPDAATAGKIASTHKSIAAAKEFCPSGKDDNGKERTGPNQCVVVARWKSSVGDAPKPSKDEVHDYFQSYFEFAPQLGTSPPQLPDHGAIANLPTWFFNKVKTDIPKVVTNFALIGDFAFATAWHLNTTFSTENAPEACVASGLTMVGTDWKGQGPPDAESPEKCGHTYHNIGTYNVHGCTQWLIIAFIPPFFVVAFRITVCHDDTVRVKEAQVVTSDQGPRGPVS